MTQSASQANIEMGKDDEKVAPKLNEFAATRIGQRLRAEFDAVIKEPVPDRFTELLNKLEEAESSRSQGEGKSGDE